ncbi:MAG: RluA family pseudouridine synthase [Syntrophobacteraceae bacterium]
MALNQGYAYCDCIGGASRGTSVLAYLSSRYRHSPESVWKERLELGEISVNGIAVRADAILNGGDRLVWRRPPWDEPEVPLDFAVLYEDESMLAVAKPGGLPTVPGGGFLEHTLFARVRRMDRSATPIHRLGRGTSGVVLFARTREARARLSEELRQHRMTKSYRALVQGNPPTDRFTVSAPIGPVPHGRLGTVHAASETGKPALSEVRVLEARQGASLVEVVIRTGKPHQIRIHLAVAGHPLVGDPLYTAGGQPGTASAALPGDIGYRLHAERVALHHPLTSTPTEIWCSPPPDLRASHEPSKTHTRILSSREPLSSNGSAPR